MNAQSWLLPPIEEVSDKYISCFKSTAGVMRSVWKWQRLYKTMLCFSFYFYLLILRPPWSTPDSTQKSCPATLFTLSSSPWLVHRNIFTKFVTKFSFFSNIQFKMLNHQYWIFSHLHIRKFQVYPIQSSKTLPVDLGYFDWPNNASFILVFPGL